MTVTKSHLEAKLDEFTRQRDQTVANLNALAGAIEVVTQLIAECEAPEHPPETAQE
jgi:hypothetical protein